MATAKSAKDFQFLMNSHESIVGRELSYTPVKELMFSDFAGSVKSLGAWGGDFVLACTENGIEYVEKYFKDKGNQVVIPYNELILKQVSKDNENKSVH